MNKESITKEVKKVIIDFFDDDDLEISENTVAADIDGWDSLAHISILASLEDQFGIHFSVSDSQQMKNVGAMIDIIEKLLNAD